MSENSTVTVPKAAILSTEGGGNFDVWFATLVALIISADALACIQGRRPSNKTGIDSIAWEAANRKAQKLLVSTISSELYVALPAAIRYDAHAVVHHLRAKLAPKSSDVRALLFHQLVSMHQLPAEMVAKFELRWTAVMRACLFAGIQLDEAAFAYLAHFAARPEFARQVSLRVDGDASALEPETDEDFAPDLPDALGTRGLMSRAVTSVVRASVISPALVFKRLAEAERTASGSEASANYAGTESRPPPYGACRPPRTSTPSSSSSPNDPAPSHWHCSKCRRFVTHPTVRHDNALHGRAAGRPGPPPPAAGGAVAKAAAGEVNEDASVNPCFCETRECEAIARPACAVHEPGTCPDSGCTETMHNALSAFDPSTYRTFTKLHWVRLADDRRIPAIGQGSLEYVSRVDGRPRKLVLERAWHVPTLGAPLVSINRLADAGYATVFEPGGICSIREGSKDGDEIAQAAFGKFGWQLIGQFTRYPLEAAAKVSASLETWHCRLGHANFRDIKTTAAKVRGMIISGSSGKGCRACDLAKARELPHPRSLTHYEHPLELVVTDLFGAPTDLPAFGGYYYGMIAKDVATGFQAGFLLPSKGHASERLTQLILSWERLTGRKCKTVRFDGGGEFKDFAAWSRAVGITVNTTMPATSQQNGKAERAIRTANESTIALMAANRCAGLKLPRDFWGKAFLAGIYAANLTLRPGMSEVPAAAFYGRPVSADRLRVFGAEATVFEHKSKHSRFDDKGVEARFVGYAEGDGQKAWRFWNAEKGFFSAYSARFHEGPIVDAMRRSVFDQPAAPPAIPEPERRYISFTVPSEIEHIRPSTPQMRVQTPPAIEPGTPTPAPQHLSAQPNFWVDAGTPPRPSRLPLPIGAPVDSELMRLRSGRIMNARVALAEEEEEAIAALATAGQERKGSIKVRDGQWYATTEPGHPPSFETLKPHCEPPLAGPGTSLCDCAHCTTEPGAADHDGAVVASAYRSLGGSHDEREPRSLKEALRGPYADLFRQGLADEEAGHVRNGTWVEVAEFDVPTGATVLRALPVLALKTDAETGALKGKVRIVALGNRQTPTSFDPDRISSPTVRPETIRAVFALSALEDRELGKVDVSQAYCHAPLKETIFLRLWDGRLVRLIKALYGLKQAGRAWYELLVQRLGERDLAPTQADPCLFVGRYRGEQIYVLVHVDDMTFSYPRGQRQVFDALVEDLRRVFLLKVLPPTAPFLAMRVRQDLEEGTISVDQLDYAEKLVRKYGFVTERAKPVHTPLPVGLILSRTDVAKTDAEREAVAQLNPPEVLGELLFLARMTRPDMLRDVAYCCRFTAFAGPLLITAIKHILRYLSGSTRYGLQFRRDGNGRLVAWSDADWAGDLDTRKSTTGFVEQLAGGPIGVLSKLQSCVSLSSTQAETQAASATCRDLCWVQQLFADLGRPELVTRPPLRVDNEGAIALASNSTHHERSKHIDVQHLFVREMVEKDLVKVIRTDTNSNLADILTKSLSRHVFERHRAALIRALPR
jgi:hypothetical protein